MKLIGLFGGTFDPVHLGHELVATALYKKLPFEQIQWIPCGDYPPHRNPPIASATDRLAMIQLVMQNHSEWVINDLEIKKTTTTYTIETVQTIRLAFPSRPLCLIMASDAFAQFDTWHQWKNILNYCHLIVVDRPGYAINTEQKKLLTRYHTKNSQELTNHLFGKVWFESINALPISATLLRKQLSCGDYSSAEKSLPKSVLDYIKTHKLYLAE